MSSIKNLLQIPLAIHPFLRNNDMLDPEYDTPVETTCYAEEKVNVVNDKEGKEVVSNITLYVDGSDTLKEADMVTYYGKDYNIKALMAIRELDGTCVLWQVYV